VVAHKDDGDDNADDDDDGGGDDDDDDSDTNGLDDKDEEEAEKTDDSNCCDGGVCIGTLRVQLAEAETALAVAVKAVRKNHVDEVGAVSASGSWYLARAHASVSLSVRPSQYEPHRYDDDYCLQHHDHYHHPHYHYHHRDQPPLTSHLLSATPGALGQRVGESAGNAILAHIHAGGAPSRGRRDAGGTCMHDSVTHECEQ
jgi:hypothetical protein